jgi:hypothetical protein
VKSFELCIKIAFVIQETLTEHSATEEAPIDPATEIKDEVPPPAVGSLVSKTA